MSVCTVFVFMALMEYCLVNIVLGKLNRNIITDCCAMLFSTSGDSPMPKLAGPPPAPKKDALDEKLDKFFDVATSKVSRNPSKVSWSLCSSKQWIHSGFHSQNGRRETRCSQQEDANDSPHPYLHQRRSCQSENILNLSDIPPAPPRPVLKFTPAQIRLRRAVHVDKFSRVGFPLTFAFLNCTYWYMFYEYI